MIVFLIIVEANTIGVVVTVVDVVMVLVTRVIDGKRNLLWRLVACSSTGSCSSIDETKA